jgi:hypothetical protein
MLGAMPLFDRDTRKHMGTQVEALPEAPEDPSATSCSSSDAENSAAHIARLVRRTAERNALPGPSSVASVAAPGATAVHHLMPFQPAPQQTPQQATQQVTQQVEAPKAPQARKPRRRPPTPILVAASTVVAVLIATGIALSRPVSSDARPPSQSRSHSQAQSGAGLAPSGYAVKLTDVITDCASHSHGKTKSSFEAQNCVKATRSLATGRVRGRPALFVVARIQMASVEAAAAVKQVLDATGTGNLNDLLREGKSFPGAPETMPRSGYASVQTGSVIRVAETGFVDGGPSLTSNPALRAAAAQVASLVTAG